MIRTKKTLLASSIAAAVGGVVTSPAFSQGVEEVVVTGIRGSLERSMDIKRDAVGVVDAISAEDIGKFPDTNLAESLQRITGVSIDRTRDGEGQEITVRGFGASNNLILLNGRHMPGSQNPDGGSGSRAFDFSNLASEAVSGVEVLKTSKASMPTGGLGATVNVKTLRPLDRPGTHLTASVAALNDTTNRTGDDITPEISGLFSWTNDDETIGVAITHAIQDRHSGTGGGFQTQLNTQVWDSDPSNNVLAAAAVAGANLVNAPADGELWTRFADVRYFTEDVERERTNTLLTLQFAPNEQLTATLDYVFAERDTRNLRKEQSIWFVDAAVSQVVFADGPVKTPVIWQEDHDRVNPVDPTDYLNPQDFSFAQQLRHSKNELDSVGLNLDFEKSDTLSFTMDWHSSTSTSQPSTLRGQKANLSVACFCIDNQGVDWRSELPTMFVDILGGSYGPSDMTTTRGEADWIDNETEIDQLQLSGSWDLEMGRLDFGIETRDVKNQMRFARIQPVFGNWGGLDPALVPDSFWTPSNILGDIDDFGVGAGVNSNSMGWNFDEVAAWIEEQNAAETATELASGDNVSSPDEGSFWDFPPVGTVDGRFQPDRIWHQNRTIEEETTSFFVQWSMSMELGGMEANLVAGIRHETTDVTSTDLVAEPLSINWEDDNDFTITQGPIEDAIEITRTGDYDHTLPSIDFDLALSDDLKFRASYSETIGRAAYDDLAASVSNFQRDEQAATAVGGNPGLLPLESQNIDLSVEWYYGDTSYVSVGYYQKATENFIGEATIPLSPFAVTDPFLGPRRQQAEADVGGIGAGLGAIHDRVGLNDPNLSAGDTVVGNSTDPIAVFNTTVPTNEKDADFDGFELAIQHMFGESGFGIIVNYTTVDGDTEFNNAAIGDQFALTGLSDTYNVIGFYDDGTLQARLALNWRDEFLDNTSATGFNDPAYTEEFQTLDLSVSYAISDDLEVFFQGINLTEENERRHGRTVDQLVTSNQYGARYLIGARYTFF